MSARRPFIAYWIGEEPTGPTHSPTLADIPAALADSIDLIIINYVMIKNGELDFSVVTKYNDQETIMGWIAAIRARQKNLPTKTKFSLGIENGAFYELDPNRFATQVAEAAKNWGMDGIDIDYEPPTGDRRIFDVVKAIKGALPAGSLLTTPIYAPWVDDEDVKPLLAPYAALFDYVTTMDYTPYVGYDSTIDYLMQYATAIGGKDPYGKLVIGVSCMDFSEGSGNHTPLDDVRKLCVYKPPQQTSPGMMLYTLSYDAPGHTTGKYPYKQRFTYAAAIAKLVHPS